MTSTSHDVSAKTDLQPLAKVVRALYATGGVRESDCLLIGAAARDVLLRHVYGIEPGRDTRDVDFAIAVADWETFDALRKRLIDSGEFSERPGPATHRLRHRSGAPLDIVPFGGVERSDRTIAWPPEHKEIFDCFGLQEALVDSHAVLLPDGVTVRVASIPALALLKVTAWRDRKHEDRDAHDLLLYLRKFLDCGQMDSAALEHPDIFDEPDFDYEIASACLLGRHMAGILDTESVEHLLTVLVPETDPEGTALLAHQSGLEIERACRLLLALTLELAGEPERQIS